MDPRIIDGPGKTTFEDSFKYLQIALDQYGKIPPDVEEGSMADAIHVSVDRYLREKGVNIDLPFHDCVLMSLGTSAAAGVAFRDLCRSVRNVPHSVNQTLTRSMIMGASRIIYVYSEPDREEKVKKAVGILAQEFKYAAAAASEFSSFQHYIPLKRETSWADDLKRAAHLLRDVSSPVSETEIIKAATAVVREALISGNPRGEEVKRIPDEQVRYSWRFMSANAHGYAWPTLYGADAYFSPGSPEDDLIWACNLLLSASYLARKNSVVSFVDQ